MVEAGQVTYVAPEVSKLPPEAASYHSKLAPAGSVAVNVAQPPGHTGLPVAEAVGVTGNASTVKVISIGANAPQHLLETINRTVTD